MRQLRAVGSGLTGRILYLSGHYRPELPTEIGVMNTPAIGYALPPDRLWAADTGCFSRPDRYTDDWYLGWLESRGHTRDRCLFATAPDVWGDGPATLDKGVPVLKMIRSLGYQAALVVQPGVTHRDIPWGEVDAIFVGGPNEWHDSDEVQAIVDEANLRGRWTHRGRVNSFRRLAQSRMRGYRSADGTCIAFEPKVAIPKVKRWLQVLDRQVLLPFGDMQ